MKRLGKYDGLYMLTLKTGNQIFTTCGNLTTPASQRKTGRSSARATYISIDSMDFSTLYSYCDLKALSRNVPSLTTK